MHMLEPNHQCDGIGMSLGHERGALMDGISALMKDDSEIPHSFYHVRLQAEVLFMNQEVGFH